MRPHLFRALLPHLKKELMSQTSDVNTLTAKSAVPKLLQLLVLLSAALILSLIANVGLSVFVFKKKTEAFAVSESGRVVPLVPLDKPYVNDPRIVAFAEECLRGSFGHDYENYRMTMNTAKNCYTSEGARDFEAAMEPLLADLKTKNLVISSTLEPTAVERTYKLAGVVHWETVTPMVLYRRGTRDALTPLRFRVTTVIQRVALDEQVRGISVRSINLKPLS